MEIKLQTQFEFDAAHRLVGHQGACSRLHGHRWYVELEVRGNKSSLDDVGILWDFGEVKMLEAQYDHRTLLKNCPENHDLADAIIKTCGLGSIYPMDENPTAEHIAYDILRKIKRKDLTFKVRVYESPKSYAEVEG